jgi:hypothetical protein
MRCFQTIGKDTVPHALISRNDLSSFKNTREALALSYFCQKFNSNAPFRTAKFS